MIPLALLLGAQMAWAPNLASATREAGKDRVAMAFFRKADCPWCERLEKETYASPEFAALAKALVPVRLEGDGAAAAESERLGVRGYPTMLFLSGRGAVVGRIQGYVSADAIAFEATEALRRARGFETAPRSRRAWADRAAVAAAQRDEKGLRDALERLGSVGDEASGAARLAAGVYFEEEMQIGEARAQFERAALTGDARVRAHAFLGLARTYLSTDRFTDAARNLEAAMSGRHLFASERELAERLLKLAREKGGGAPPPGTIGGPACEAPPPSP